MDAALQNRNVTRARCASSGVVGRGIIAGPRGVLVRSIKGNPTVLLGGGERLFEGIDVRALGYECVHFVASEKATHIVLRRQGCQGRLATVAADCAARLS